MKVAVASSNGSAISKHFGRSAYFIIYTIENSELLERELRKNVFTAHAAGHHENHGRGNNKHHSHQGIISALHDCEAVLCFGMGMRVAADLKANNIKTFVLENDCTPDEAVSLYQKGLLSESAGGFCKGHEH